MVKTLVATLISNSFCQHHELVLHCTPSLRKTQRPALAVTFLPTTFFADGAGVIRSRVRHALTLEELEAAAQAQLK
jgi:hypothetical protein